jgi:apolipoprotein N-acyltransferase
MGPGTKDRLTKGMFVVAGAVALFLLQTMPPFDSALWLPLLLAGPALTGLVMRLRGWPWGLGAASWAGMGVVSLFYDWILHNEDQAFHVVLIAVEPLLVAAGAGIGRLVASIGHRVASRTEA